LALQGTAHRDNWTVTSEREEINEILARAANLEPSIRNARVVDWKVGLRPGRTELRLELDEITTSVPVIHNYGHGGSGWTLHWGCATDVAQLAMQALAANQRAKL